MPKVEVKEKVKTRKKASTANEKKEKDNQIVETKKGKVDPIKTEKSSNAKDKTTKSKVRETPKEKLIEKKEKAVKDAKNKVTKKVSSEKNKIVKETVKQSTRAKKTIDSNKAKTNKKNALKKVTTTKKIAKSTDKKEKLEKIIKTKSKTVTKKNIEKTYLPEYYDLPYRYNETIVKILYQTPKRIFVYWDISDKDRQIYLNAFGEDFFEKTYPVLLVHNEELDYTFEVPINDFANSWYLDINDPKMKYVVKLGRKFKKLKEEQINYEIVKKENINFQNDFVYIADSNKLETPNDRILFEKVPEKIIYKNVKTGSIIEKEIKQVLGKISKIYKNPQVEVLYKDLYKELYGEEILNEEIDILNPSSLGNSSSFLK